MKAKLIDPQTDPLWRKLVEQQPSDVFHSPVWLQVLAETYAINIRAYVLLDNSEEPVAGVPFGQISDTKDNRLVTLPFSDYCDPLAGNTEHWQALATALLAETPAVTIRCLHNQLPLADKRFTVVNKAKWHGLDLQADLDSLWKGIKNSARRAIKKAQREAVTIQAARSKKELRQFFELHLGVRKNKYRLLAQPYRFFENIWDNFVAKHNGVLMIAIYQEQLIGGTLFLAWQNKLYYKFNASSPAFAHLRPNDLIIWEGIKHAQAKGYCCLDFGLSDWDQEGLVRYKRKFATNEKTISFLSATPLNGSTSPAKQQFRQLLPQLTELFTDDAVPDHITEQAGEILYKYFV